MPDVTPPAVGSNHDGAAFAALAAAVMEQATTFVGICDAQLRPCFLNAAGRAMVGLSLEADIADYAIPDFFTPEDRAVIETVGLPAMLREGHWEGGCAFATSPILRERPMCAGRLSSCATASAR